MKRLPVLVILLAAAPLDAQRGPGRFRAMRDAITAAFAPVVERVDPCVVAVRRGGAPVALGTVVDAEGLVVTKASELGEGDLTCVVAGQERALQRIGVDDLCDLALLRVDDPEGLAAAPWADTEPQRGAFVVSPDGDDTPAGIGIVSAAPYSHSAERGFLGVQLEATPSGVRLSAVTDGTAAQRAGLAPNDVILALDGAAMADRSAFISAIQAHKPGDSILLRVQRGEDEMDVTATLLRDRRGPRSNQEGLWGPLSEVRAGFGTVLQHDTILTPAECGGPLVDLDGKVVGVNIARAGRVETLALPIADVRAAVARIRAATGSPAGRGGHGPKPGATAPLTS